MPAKSKKQFAFMQAVAHGKSTKKGAPSKAQAAEFVKGQSPKGLPAKSKPKSKKGK